MAVQTEDGIPPLTVRPLFALSPTGSVGTILASAAPIPAAFKLTAASVNKSRPRRSSPV